VFDSTFSAIQPVCAYLSPSIDQVPFSLLTIIFSRATLSDGDTSGRDSLSLFPLLISSFLMLFVAQPFPGVRQHVINDSLGAPPPLSLSVLASLSVTLSLYLSLLVCVCEGDQNSNHPLQTAHFQEFAHTTLWYDESVSQSFLFLSTRFFFKFLSPAFVL
jgi:hypothetical protein